MNNSDSRNYMYLDLGDWPFLVNESNILLFFIITILSFKTFLMEYVKYFNHSLFTTVAPVTVDLTTGN